MLTGFGDHIMTRRIPAAAALAHTALVYLTTGATCGLIWPFAVFNHRKRTLHDILSGMLMVRGPVRIMRPFPFP